MAKLSHYEQAAALVRAEIDDLRREGHNLRALQLGAALAVLTGESDTLKLVGKQRAAEPGTVFGLKVVHDPRLPKDVVVLRQPSQTCTYPACNCPFDHPGKEGWCARGFATGRGEVASEG